MQELAGYSGLGSDSAAAAAAAAAAAGPPDVVAEVRGVEPTGAVVAG